MPLCSAVPQTTGFTGADLANLVNEAALLAGRSNKGAWGGLYAGPAVERCEPDTCLLPHSCDNALLACRAQLVLHVHPTL